MNFSEKAQQIKEWWRLVNQASKQRAIVYALTIQKNRLERKISKIEIVNNPLSALFNWGIDYPCTLEYTIINQNFLETADKYDQAQEEYNKLVQQRRTAWKQLWAHRK